MLFTTSELHNRADAYLAATRQEKFASLESLCESFAFDSDIEYDIFLSNRYVDKKSVTGLATMLREDFNLSVYIDWEDDLDRNNVNKETAQVIRRIIESCKCLWYVASEHADASKWMPWEVGYMDGKTGRVAICPVVKTTIDDVYEGREYLSLYPYVSKQKDTAGAMQLWINETAEKYVGFKAWLSGKEPRTRH